MNCHYCGAEVSGHEIFCRNCGTRQNSEDKKILPAAEAAAPVYEAPISAQEEIPPIVPVSEKQSFAWQSLEETPAPNVAPLFGLEAAPTPTAPRIQLPTKRGLGKMIFLSILTLGIYPIVIFSRLSGEVNMVASRYDGERTLSFFGMVFLAPPTLGILPLVWMHKLCRRIGTELERRNVDYAFGPRDFWLWNFLFGLLCSICTAVSGAMLSVDYGSYILLWILLAVSLLTLVGPFVFMAKLMKAMNKLNADYNVNG